MIALSSYIALVLASENTPAGSGPEAFGVGALALIVAAAAGLAWLAYLLVKSLPSRRALPEETPPNLEPYLSDDELEDARLTRVLRAAVVAAAVLAIVLPFYAAKEPARQATAAETLQEEDVAAGEYFFVKQGCSACHGIDGGGGAAEFVEPRSGVTTAWVVPSLNDVFYRYSEDEVRTWIVFGRAGTPMPPNGLAGGGAMTDQEVDQVIAYLRSLQIPQAEAVAKADAAVRSALDRIATGDAVTAQYLAVQEAKILDVQAAPQRVAVAGDFPDRIEDLLGGPGTCTEASGDLVKVRCTQPGEDSDRDGLSDAAEAELDRIATTAYETLVALNETKTKDRLEPVFDPKSEYDVSFDPETAFTNRTGGGQPIPDLDAADALLETLRTDVLLLQVTAERQDAFLADLEVGLAFLRQAAETRRWATDEDFAAVAERMTAQQRIDSEVAASQASDPSSVPPAKEVTPEEAARAVGLFNAYCARCHTGGWSAGPPFEIGPGRGAWGPAIANGRTVAQFPNWLDHVEFVIRGADSGQPFGVNGLGSGRMPAFGQVLSEEDIQLIVMYERSL